MKCTAFECYQYAERARWNTIFSEERERSKIKKTAKFTFYFSLLSKVKKLARKKKNTFAIFNLYFSLELTQDFSFSNYLQAFIHLMVFRSFSQMALNIELDGFEYLSDSDVTKLSPALKQPPISPIESESSSGISSLDSDDLKVSTRLASRAKKQQQQQHEYSSQLFFTHFDSLSLLCESFSFAVMMRWEEESAKKIKLDVVLS